MTSGRPLSTLEPCSYFVPWAARIAIGFEASQPAIELGPMSLGHRQDGDPGIFGHRIPDRLHQRNPLRDRQLLGLFQGSRVHWVRLARAAPPFRRVVAGAGEGGLRAGEGLGTLSRRPGRVTSPGRGRLAPKPFAVGHHGPTRPDRTHRPPSPCFSPPAAGGEGVLALPGRRWRSQEPLPCQNDRSTAESTAYVRNRPFAPRRPRAPRFRERSKCLLSSYRGGGFGPAGAVRDPPSQAKGGRSA